VFLWDQIATEPTVETFHQAMTAARDVRPDAVVGLGGGSVLDVAKLVAAMLGSERDIRDAFGIDKLAGRSIHLACLPTTAGTGSEVSPNAILLDEADQLKKGLISPHLMPDAAYVDPALTLTVPPAVTAATGMDALTHCIEAYANRFAHPLIDLYALQGIRLIAQSLEQAVRHGDDLAARTNLALGSMYGGMCLGPVNTGAVHALAYPLGGEFHIAHGVSNALLLPHVLAFNLPAAPQRYAQIAIAMGEPAGANDLDTATRGLARIADLSRRCGVPQRLSEIGIPQSAIERMAIAAMTVTRLLERNVREMTLNDAIAIYRSAF
jgi:alcohol dehydrogenase class IV